MENQYDSKNNSISKANANQEQAQHAGAQYKPPPLKFKFDQEIEEEEEETLQPKFAKGIVQREIDINGTLYQTRNGQTTNTLINSLKSNPKTTLLKDWIGDVRDMAANEMATYQASDEDDFIETYLESNDKYKKKGEKRDRPSFNAAGARGAVDYHTATTGVDHSGANLADINAARPHRFPYADIRNNVLFFVKGKDDGEDLVRWTDRLLASSTDTLQRVKESNDIDDNLKNRFETDLNKQIADIYAARDSLINAASQAEIDTVANDLIAKLNSLISNIKGLGPQSVNAVVSNRIHVNVEDGALSPSSKQALEMSPDRADRGVAVTPDEEYVILVTGDIWPISQLSEADQQLLGAQKFSPVDISEVDKKWGQAGDSKRSKKKSDDNNNNNA
ncbi:MAG: hypothetical protein AAFO07_13315 [Bacteroidota bacterium]